MTTTAAAATIDLLAEAGVRRFYTVPGESFLELIDEVVRRPELELISTRHESGAAFMAEAEGKLTGRPAVAMATRAVGATNLAIGVHTAHQDSTPMLVLLGQVETDHLGKEAFQEVDLPGFFAQLSTFGATVQRADRAADVVARALAMTTSGRPGPAVVAFPSDLLGQPGRPAGRRVPARPGPHPGPAAVAAAAGLLERAARPVVILGEGAQDGHEVLTSLAERYGLGVYTAFRRQDTFPNTHPHYLGHLTLGAAPELLEPLRTADVVLVLGSRLDGVTTQTYALPADGTRVVQVDTQPDTLGSVVPLELAVVADVRAFAAALIEQADPSEPTTDWRDAHARYLAFSDPTAPHDDATGGVHPADVMAALRRGFADDTVVTSDAGNFSVFGHRYWRFERPRTQLAPISGAMGYAVPAAIGAALAARDRQVLALAGDGGFLMTGQELETAARYGVEPTVVVFQNLLYGTIAMHQARELRRTGGVDIGPVDLAGFARSLGAAARTVTDTGQLDDALAELRREAGPRVLVVRTDSDVLTPAARLSGLMGARA
ncbi:thiamine pyrophosphate-dependent enzyme [Jiangella alba]|uniref:Acetolactate synthase-1/2/3 large subunit n=1 Tax=Jiangella alba TaxID=561176 RepID=A0A1H5PPY0_9ACTN|nr:thiamine pyrophosphate-dependent enzyme [Jiangella alba]SEF15846.1 acetolactate synthase-1/2/3 large subunit [Jiangella alba]